MGDINDVPDWVKYPKKKKKSRNSMDLFIEDTEGVTSSTTAATTTSVTIAAKTADNSESLSKKKESTLIESMQLEEPKRKSKKQDTNDLPNIDELPPETSTNSTTTPIPKKIKGEYIK